MEHDRLFKEECAAAAAAAAAQGDLQEVGGEGAGEDSAPTRLGKHVDKDSVHSLESLALLEKSDEAAGNNTHSLPAAAF